MLIDVHAHLNDKTLITRIEEIIQDAKNCGIEKIICVSDSLNSSKAILEIAKKYENIYASLGVHPSVLDSFNEEFVDLVIKNSTNEKVVAIGEIGLDYHFEPFDKNQQMQVFTKQLELANQIKLPVQIHCRDAMKDMLKILNSNKQLLKQGGIVHCFSGNLNDLNQIQELGLKISLGGVVTFKNSKDLQNLIKDIPLEMIMFETDCPYLTPHPYRGKINEPKYMALNAKKVAELKNIPYKEMFEISTNNCLDVFKKII
jgi:TatD DNase family protein